MDGIVADASDDGRVVLMVPFLTRDVDNDDDNVGSKLSCSGFVVVVVVVSLDFLGRKRERAVVRLVGKMRDQAIVPCQVTRITTVVKYEHRINGAAVTAAAFVSRERYE